MSIIICSNCGLSFSSHSKKCPRCKANIDFKREKIKRILCDILMLSTFVLLFIIIYPITIWSLKQFKHFTTVSIKNYPISFKDNGAGETLIILTGPTTFNFYTGESNIENLSQQEFLNSNLSDIQIDYKLLYNSTYSENKNAYYFMMKFGLTKEFLSNDFHEEQFIKTGSGWFEKTTIEGGKVQYIPIKNTLSETNIPNQVSKGFKEDYIK